MIGSDIGIAAGVLANAPLFIGDYAPRAGEIGIAAPQYRIGDVRRYGASTGAADNAAAFNRAMQSAKAIGSGYIIVPDRFTLSSAAIAALDGVSIEGTGTGEIVQAGAFNAILGQGVFGGFDNLTVDGTFGNYSVTLPETAFLSLLSMVYIQDTATGEQEVNQVIGLPGAGVVQLMYPLSRTFTVANGSRLILVIPVTKSIVRNVKVSTVQAFEAIRYNLCDRPKVMGCDVSGGRHGVSMEISLHPRVSDCTLTQSGTVGPDGPGIGFRSTQGGEICSNRIIHQLRDEPIVLFKNCQGVRIHDNIITQPVGVGIQVDHENTNIVISHNQVTKAGTSGIAAFNSSADLTIVGNQVRDCAQDGITLDGATDATVMGNHSIRNGGWGLSINSTVLASQRVGYAGNYFKDNVAGEITDNQTVQPAHQARNIPLNIGTLETTDATTLTATAGTHGAVPAAVAGYKKEIINGVPVRVPFFAV